MHQSSLPVPPSWMLIDAESLWWVLHETLEYFYFSLYFLHSYVYLHMPDRRDEEIRALSIRYFFCLSILLDSSYTAFIFIVILELISFGPVWGVYMNSTLGGQCMRTRWVEANQAFICIPARMSSTLLQPPTTNMIVYTVTYFMLGRYMEVLKVMLP